MTTSLTVLREQQEQVRFQRQRFEEDRAGLHSVDARGLAEELRRTIRGEVRFDRGSRALYATDASNYRMVPIGVVIPREIDDVVATVAAARKFGAPVLSRGCGTSLAGQCCNVAVVMDFTKYLHHVIEIDPTRRLGRVMPGCVLDDFNHAAETRGLIFGPDPATHTRCTIGGMLGNNSCGIHSLLSSKAGFGLRTSDNTHELEILTYDGCRMRVGPTTPEELERIIKVGGRRGQIYAQLKDFRDRYADLIRSHMPRLPRRVSGYNLDELLPENGFHVARALAGSESTCVTILEAILHLVPNPGARSLLVLGYPDEYTAADHLMEILEYGPIGLEGIDDLLFDWVKQRGNRAADIALMPPGRGWLLVEFGGDSKRDADDQARKLMDDLRKRPSPPSMKLFDDPVQEHMIWEVREGSLGSTAWVPGHPDNWPGFEDSAVPPEKTADYLRALRKLMDKYDYHPSLYGHLGQGCVHCRIEFDVYTRRGLENFKSFMEEASDLVVSFGGSISGEHGDGQQRAQFIHKMFGPELMEAMRQFKAIWDPQWKMNPGKVVEAHSMTDNLRISPDYNPPQPRTHFNYTSDHSSYARAILRCVGIGVCRNETGQTMCPSYMVTREEEHSTRGRARMLWEMMNGDVLVEGWKSEQVKEALDLCLACKGCKHDCPVNVDMATYKSEFLSHYYQGRLRPRHAYAFGFAPVASHLMSYAPTLANLLTQTPGLRGIAKWLAGMQQDRSIPALAPQPFKDWWRQRAPRNIGRPPVVLFADTFNNYYHPDTARAAVEVLETAGFSVQVPMENLCCGRPLYDYGFLGLARGWLERIISALRPEIEAGTPIIVLEPSCAAVFRDELTNIMPADHAHAHRLSGQVFVLGEFIEKHASQFRLPRMDRKALLHIHCHHKSIMGREDEENVLRRMGIELDAPETGCCGMAGAFGFERGDHYAVSVACGERVLLPEVRRADERTMIVADGFSCREQIRQLTDRQSLHLAQVIQMGLHQQPLDGRPEAPAVRRRQSEQRRAMARTAGLVLAGTVAAGLLYRSTRPRPAHA